MAPGRPLRRIGLIACSLLFITSPLLALGSVPVLTVGDGLAGVGQPFTVSIVLEHDIDANGWSYGLCHDPAALSFEEAGLGADGSVVNGGLAPDFFDFQFGPDGWSVGVVINFVGLEVLGPGTFEIGTATYTALAAGTTDLCFCDTIGTPPVVTVIVYSGQSVAPTQFCGTVTITPDPIPLYRTGDANADGWVDLADPIFIVVGLLSAGPLPPCVAATDVNGDAQTDVADVVHLLAYLFTAGAPPVAPFPECDFVPGEDCVTFDVCP